MFDPHISQIYSRHMTETIEVKIDSYLNKHTHYRDKEHNLLLESDIIYENHAFALYKFTSINCSFSNILVVPSLINGPEILYLDENYSLIQLLLKNFNVHLVRWKNINDNIRHYDFDDYILEISDLLKTFDGKINIYGHCLGGNIAFAAAYLNQNKVSALTLLTTPWNFSNYQDIAAIIDVISNYDEIPAIFLEIMFFMQNPLEFSKRLNRLDHSEISYKIEKWLHSGNNMAKNTFFQITKDFVQQNIMAKNEWYVRKLHINPSLFNIHTKIVNCFNDRIVPETSILSLYHMLPNREMITLNSGHIGYLVNQKFREELEIFLQVKKPSTVKAV